MATEDKVKAAEEQVKQSFISYAHQWGESSFPPTLLATLITPLHARPFQALPMLFPPILLFTTYLNLNGYVTDAAGASAAWSGIYILLARRRKQIFSNKFGARGLVRGAALGVAAVNLVGGGLVYALGSKKDTKKMGS